MPVFAVGDALRLDTPASGKQGPPARALYRGRFWETISSHYGKTGTTAQPRHQNWPALASSTSTLSSISDKTASRPWSPEEDLRLAAASRSLLTVEASKLPDSNPILRSSST